MLILPLAVAPDQSFWDQPVVLAACVTGTVAILVLIVNAGLNTWMHQGKLHADRELSREKFSFDKESAERKFRLDRALDDWRRKSAFAEQELASFYDTASRISAIRSPASFGSESEDRIGRENESDILRQQRDKYYPIVRRFRENAEFFNAFYSKRHRALALFSQGAEAPYVDIWRTLSKISVAAGMLMREDTYAPNQAAYDHRRQMEQIIWEGMTENDAIAQAVLDAIAAAEKIFRPAIELPAIDLS